MMAMEVLFCALPGSVWETGQPGDGLDGFRTAVKDAAAIEQRTRKGVNVDAELARYACCCECIEAATAGLACIPQRWALGPGFACAVDCILGDSRWSAQAMEAGMGRCFVEPNRVPALARALSAAAAALGLAEDADVKQALVAAQEAGSRGCGLVLLADPLILEASGGAPLLHDVPVETQNTLLGGAALVDVWEERATAEKEAERDLVEHDLAASLRRQIHEGIPRGSINIGSYPNHLITEALREFVYAEGERVEVRPIYADGSQGDPFPLRCLQDRRVFRPLNGVIPVRVSLISMRHLDMDADVDMAWFRNREASRSRTLAEAERFCYRRTLSQLLAYPGDRPLVLHLYQTGFQPAIVGFYHALVEVLCQRPQRGTAATLQVTPHYFRGRQGDSDYVAGRPWD
jgi:hypothetical protein